MHLSTSRSSIFLKTCFSLKLATCNTSLSYSFYSSVCTDCPNTTIPQVIQSQSSCTMCNTIATPLDDTSDAALFLGRMTGCLVSVKDTEAT